MGKQRKSNNDVCEKKIYPCMNTDASKCLTTPWRGSVTITSVRRISQVWSMNLKMADICATSVVAALQRYTCSYWIENSIQSTDQRNRKSSVTIPSCNIYKFWRYWRGQWIEEVKPKKCKTFIQVEKRIASCTV